MGDFKDRLWRDLVREHGSRLDQLPGHHGGGHRTQRRLVAGGTVGLAGAGTVLALVLSAASSAPAFAVNRNSDGTVTVTIHQLAAIRGANHRLAQLGIPVRAAVVSADCSSPTAQAALTRVKQRTGRANQTWIAKQVAMPAVADARIEAARIPAGRVLLLAAFRKAGKLNVAAVRTMSLAAAPGCLPPGNWSAGPVTCQAGGGSAIPPALALARAKAAVAAAKAGTITGVTGTVTGATTTTVTGPPNTNTSTTETNTSTTGTTTGSMPPPSRSQVPITCTQSRSGATNTTGTSTGTTTTGTGTTTTGT